VESAPIPMHTDKWKLYGDCKNQCFVCVVIDKIHITSLGVFVTNTALLTYVHNVCELSQQSTYMW
jgi:hypothetical protein